jgi:hypothetical protein
VKQTERKLWQVHTGGLPPTAQADCVSHREDVLWGYPWPDDRRSPVLGMDEASQPLLGEVNASWPRRAGRGRGEDSA